MDGRRVLRVTDAERTIYINGQYEVKLFPNGTSEVTKYYSFGGQRIALRQNGVLIYLHTDHLGSTLAATNSIGTVLNSNQPRYYAYGAERWPSVAKLPTRYTFTGQRWDAGTGLMYYGARYYDSRLGVFIQPDTIVPDPGNPQSLNRYTYSNNNPLRYTDPTGHSPYAPSCAGIPDCGVDGWYGVSDYDRYIQPEKEQTAKAMVVALSRLVLEPFDLVMTARDCLTEGCNVPLAVIASVSSLPGGISKYLRHIDESAFQKLLALGARNGDEVTAILSKAGADTVIRNITDAGGNQIVLRAGGRGAGLRHIVGRHLTGELADAGTTFFDSSLKVGDVVDIVAHTIANGQRSRAANDLWMYQWQHDTWGTITAFVNEAGEVVSAYPH